MPLSLGLGVMCASIYLSICLSQSAASTTSARSKQASKVGVTAHVCMNRYCPNSFQVFCSTCKNDHRDHSIKVLTLQDLSFLLERLLKSPFHELTRYVSETVQVMKKLKLIKQFRKKIDILEKEVQKDALKLVEHTEALVHQHALCSRTAAHTTELLNKDSPEQYELFVQSSHSLLANLEYNPKKDRLELGNPCIKQREDKRKKSLEAGKRKIEEVRDYSMKIIEVILHNDDSSEDEQDLLFKQKHYELLKQELALDKDEQQLDEEISDLKNSSSTANPSRLKRRETQEEERLAHEKQDSKQTMPSDRIMEEPRESSTSEWHSQTDSDVLTRQQAAQQLEKQLSEMQHYHHRLENDLRLKLSIIAKEKDNLNREVGKWKERCEEKKKSIRAIESSLRENKMQRSERGKVREEAVMRIIELWQGKGTTEEKEDL